MIGTREIKVRYEKVSELIKCLNKYKKALEKMKKSIIAIREVYKEAKGKTMESLVNESDILVKYIDGLEQDVSDLSTILVKYVTETTAIIKPEQRDRIMKIDRNNILQKKNSIINTCSKIPKIHTDVTVPHFDDWILWGEDEEERELELARRARNDDKLNSIKYHIRSLEKEITSLIDKVNGVYNGVKNYEDKDRQFAWEAKKLVKDKPTPVEKHDDEKSKIGEQVIHFGEGLLDSIVDLVKGLADSTVGIVKYDASFVTYLYGELSGNEIPKWVDDYCYNTSVETNEKIKAVLNDPLIVADAIKNGVKDTYEEKGAAYCGGYAVGFIGTTFAGTKGMDKLAKLGKGGKAARTLEELGYVDDAMVTVSKASDVAMDVVASGSKVITKTFDGAEAGGMVATVGDDLAKLAEEVKTVTKAADTAEDLTKVAGMMQTATKAEELSEASKVLAEGGEAVGKGGNYSSLRDIMSLEEVARYEKYWNNVADDMLKSNLSDFRSAVLSGEIKKTTGGKINSKVLTVAIDTNTGDIYYGISGMNNNPTRNMTNPQMQEILNSVNGSMMNYPLENCGEFNAINNALNNGVNIKNLRVYSIDRASGNYKAPCINCQNLYGDILCFTE